MKKKLILFIVIITATYANAQPGTVDTSFNPGTGFNGSVYAITIQSDGKIIVGDVEIDIVNCFHFYPGCCCW